MSFEPDDSVKSLSVLLNTAKERADRIRCAMASVNSGYRAGKHTQMSAVILLERILPSIVEKGLLGARLNESVPIKGIARNIREYLATEGEALTLKHIEYALDTIFPKAACAPTVICGKQFIRTGLYLFWAEVKK